MNALAIEMQTDPIIHLHRDGVEGGRSSTRWQIDVAQEMLSTMDTLTFGGQRYLMEKIVALIKGVSSKSRPAHSRRNRIVLREQLEHLTQLATRQCPDASVFVHRAQGLLDLLAAVP